MVHAEQFGSGFRPPRCVSTGPVVVRLAGMANEREREREFPKILFVNFLN